MTEKSSQTDVVVKTGDQDVIHALRTTQLHQVQLSVIADQKANINIGFTLFFITLSQSQFSVDLSIGGAFKVGFIVFILSIFTSLLLAIMVVLPRTAKFRIQRPEQMSNPFHFGMFTQLTQEVYVDYLAESLTDNNHARRLMSIDIYQIGRVLNRKYRLLRFSYSFLALSVIIALMLYCYKIVLIL